MLKALVGATRGRPKNNIGESHRWDDVGGVDGYIGAVNTLGDDYQEMDKKGVSAKNINSIWSRLAAALSLKNRDEDTRKWLKLVWKDDRRKVRTTFYASKISEIEQAADCDDNKNIFQSKLVTNNSISSSNSSSQKSSSSSSPCTSKIRRCKTNSSPTVSHAMLFFAVTYDEWKMFFDERPNHWGLKSDWTNKLYKYLVGINITCTLVFQYNHVKQRESRKRKSPLFHCIAHCKHHRCPIYLHITVKKLPEKNEQTIFYVEKFGTEQHSITDKTIGRQLTGKERQIQAEMANAIGSLKTYEANVREADLQLLRAGNHSFVPSIDAIRTAKSNYNKDYRFDNDPVKDLLIFQEALIAADTTSKSVKGYIHVIQHVPFAVHCTSEALIERYYRYRKTTTYSYINIDATGSVVRKINKKQSAPFYYALVFKDDDDPSNLIPLGIALLSDHTTADISAFLLTIRKLMVAVKTNYRAPSFFVCDFSLAIMNSLLIVFNHEDMNRHLERCWSILHKKYSSSELRSSFLIRICCAHVMHAFVRYLHKIKIKKDERHQCTKLFAILLNTDTLENAFALFDKILTIYGDANALNTDKSLSHIVDVTNILDFDLQEFLKDEIEPPAEESLTPPIEDTFAASEAIIHCSPFTCEARKRFPLLQCILKAKKDNNNNNNIASNPHYSRDIILILYRWYAYLPLWSCIMSEYYERYANDKTASLNNSVLGRGCVSNVPVETHFSTVKQSLLQGKLHLRPMDFISTIYSSITARLKTGELGLAQTARGRKLTKGKPSDVLQVDVWRRKGRQTSKGHLRGKYFSTVKKKKEINDPKRLAQSKNNNNLCEQNCNSLLIPQYITDSSVEILGNKPILTTDSDGSSDSSFGFSKVKQKDREKTVDNASSLFMNPNNEQLNCATSTSVFDSKVSEKMLPNKDYNNTNTRPVRRRIPNRQLDSYFVQPVRSSSSTRQSRTSMSSVSSLNCSESSRGMSADSSILTSDSIKRRPIKSIAKNSKKSKTSPQKMMPPPQLFDKASIGNIALPWPRYNIKSTLFNGIVYTITNTCSVDSVLFVYYLIFKTASTLIKNLFSNGSDSIYSILNKTMQLVDTNGWDIARLYWLKTNNRLLANTNAASSTTTYRQDLFGMVDDNAYRYLRAMQTYIYSTECTATDCPKRKQSRKGAEIALSAFLDGTGTYPNFIDHFAGDTFANCGVSISKEKPAFYSGKIWLDEHFPVYNIETGKQEASEPMYCCDNVKVVSVSKFLEIPPVIIVQIQPITQVFMLPDIIHVGDHRYLFRAAICGNNVHFTATIKINEKYYKFDDMHYKGVFEYDSADFAESAIYSIMD